MSNESNPFARSQPRDPAPAAPSHQQVAAPVFGAFIDPAEYEWTTVYRKPRRDGWTPERQREFIAALAETGCVEHAARKVRISAVSAYRLRRAQGAESFCGAWDNALRYAYRPRPDALYGLAFVS